MSKPRSGPPSLLPQCIETVLFDAGGVLVDVDYAYMMRLIRARRVETTLHELSRAEAVARAEVHKQIALGGSVSDGWRDYFHYILGHVGVPMAEQSQVIDSLWEAHQRFGLWRTPIEGGKEAVAEAKRRGYRVGVVSNAEGKVARDLESAGYGDLFETIVDSHLVGVEKPDPAIFHIALERLGARAESAVFIGDLPSVDVVGARAAGLGAILVDPHDLYVDWEVQRLHGIGELPAVLDRARE